MLVPMQSAGEESCDAWPPPACSQSPDLLCCLVRRVALLSTEWLTKERKLFLPASAKLAHHATLTERGPWWTGDGANMDAKQLAPMEDTTITPMHTQQRHLWDSNPVGQSPSAWQADASTTRPKCPDNPMTSACFSIPPLARRRACLSANPSRQLCSAFAWACHSLP